jgi:hypothetical protein
VALDATWFAGGQSRVNGVESPDRRRNSRLGATLSIMTVNNQSLKLTYSTGDHAPRHGLRHAERDLAGGDVLIHDLRSHGPDPPGPEDSCAARAPLRRNVSNPGGIRFARAAACPGRTAATFSQQLWPPARRRWRRSSHRRAPAR